MIVSVFRGGYRDCGKLPNGNASNNRTKPCQFTERKRAD